MATNDDDTPPLGDPGARRSGASTGGMASTADGGLRDATQRSFERGIADATGGARSGEAMSGGTAPRTDLGGTNEPGSGPGSRPGVDRATGLGDTSDATARHGPGATASAETPRDTGWHRDHGLRGTPPGGSPAGNPTGAGAVEDLPEAAPGESAAGSLGRAVSEVVTGVFDAHHHPSKKEDGPERR